MSETVSQAAGRVVAIYARVSSERQREEGTIASQLAGLRELAAERGLIVADELVFCDEGVSGATLVRPALERLRAGVEVVFAREPERTGSPEDELLRQFQGMIAEYERAQIRERTRRGKLHRARTGSQAVMSGAPYGYRYVRKSEHCDAYWEIDELEAQVVREVFARYVDDGVSIGEIA